MTDKPIVLDITQRFAEGFDPDRIAAIFQEEVQGQQPIGIKNDHSIRPWGSLG